METELIVDGKNIEMNRFVQEILAATIIGATGTLKGVGPDCKEIQVTIKM